jgi:predicted TIM-barrel fold metal-dependent hydrolase
MLIYDADTHFVPIDVFSEIDQDYSAKLQSQLQKHDVDSGWVCFYNSIKDKSWPQIACLDDFYKLPKKIKQEIHDQHSTPGLYISSDLKNIFYDPLENQWPDLKTTELAGQYLLKTTRQVINIHGVPFSYRNPLFGTEFMTTYNRVMLEFCKQNSRFDTPLTMSLGHFKESMDELEKYQSSKFFGIGLIDQHPWGFLPMMEPLYKFCNDRKIPLYLHLTRAWEESSAVWSWDQQNSNYLKLKNKFKENYRKEFFTRTTESSNWIIGLLSFITQGVLDRYPDLRIISTENGLAWIPGVRQWCLENGFTDPLPYFQTNFWFTAEIEEAEFLDTARLLGWDRLLYATDYPHNDIGGSNRFNDLDMIKKMLEDQQLTPSEFDQFTHKNYQKLLDRV